MRTFASFRVKFHQLDCKYQEARQCSLIQICKSIVDVTKPCVCVVMPFCWLYNVEFSGPATEVSFHRSGYKENHAELLCKCHPQMPQMPVRGVAHVGHNAI